jgi:hypothetical protein
MTTATLQQSNSYFTDVYHAARAFTSALFAAQERQYIATEVAAPAVPEADLVKGRRELFSLARDVEALSPNLANELRGFASRG